MPYKRNRSLGLHMARDREPVRTHLFNNFVYGAPPFAPLLFPNLVVARIDWSQSIPDRCITRFRQCQRVTSAF